MNSETLRERIEELDPHGAMPALIAGNGTYDIPISDVILINNKLILCPFDSEEEAKMVDSVKVYVETTDGIHQVMLKYDNQIYPLGPKTREFLIAEAIANTIYDRMDQVEELLDDSLDSLQEFVDSLYDRIGGA